MIICWHNFVPLFGGSDFHWTRNPVSPKYTQGRNLEIILRLASRYNGKSLAEIGTARGDTTAALARACPQSRVITFDVCRELVGHTDSKFDNEIRPSAEVGKIFRDDPELVHRITSVIAPPIQLRQQILQNGPYHFIFIDGSHLLPDVVADTKVAFATAVVNGIIVWDDYWDQVPAVKKVIDNLNRRTGNRITLVRDSRICYLQMSPEMHERMLKFEDWSWVNDTSS